MAPLPRTALIIVAIAFGGVGSYIYLALHGVLAKKYETTDLVALLSQDTRIVLPEGKGPFPAVVLLHACGGIWRGDYRMTIMDIYAEIAAKEGVAAIVVDSFKPRGIDTYEAALGVCTGLEMRGSERAGDAVAGLAIARSLPNVDPRRLALAGWSHGGWAIMDLLAMRPPDQLPDNLHGWPDQALDGLVAVYLTYPYCGFPALAPKAGFAKPVTTWVVHGSNDIIANPLACEPAYRLSAAVGADVNALTIEGATHSFDEPDVDSLTGAVFDPVRAEIAHQRFRAFLYETLIPGQPKRAAAGSEH